MNGASGRSGPKVSIGVPVYNGENYLAPGLESLLGQSFADFEIIIADNASTDGTEEICRRYARDDDRIRYYRHDENRGAAFNFNHVVHHARGAYFKWHAHDDGCLPGYLERCVGVLDDAPANIALAQCRSVLINERGEPYANYGQERNDIASDLPHERLRQLIAEIRLCTYVFGLMRTDVLRQTRLIDAFVSSDIVLLVELALRGKFLIAQDFLQLRRVHLDSSRLKNTSSRDLREWFRPGSKRGSLLPPRARYGMETLRSIARAPLSVGERRRCYSTFCTSALKRRIRNEELPPEPDTRETAPEQRDATDSATPTESVR